MIGWQFLAAEQIIDNQRRQKYYITGGKWILAAAKSEAIILEMGGAKIYSKFGGKKRKSLMKQQTPPNVLPKFISSSGNLIMNDVNAPFNLKIICGRQDNAASDQL